MNKKLTLSVDEVVIERAKKRAAEEHKSLSEMVESYLRVIASDEKGEDTQYSSTVEELLGSISVPDDFSYETAKLEFLKNKYPDD